MKIRENKFQISLSHFWVAEKKKREERHRKKKFLNSAYKNVDPHLLVICSLAFCRVFAYAVIHTAKRRICLVLRS